MTRIADLDPHPATRPAWQPVVLAAAVATPLLIVLPVFVDHRLAAVLYREPKRWACILIAWWLSVALVTWLPHRTAPQRLAAALRMGPLALLVAFAAWGGLTAKWAMVPALVGFELRQWLAELTLAVVLVSWAQHDSRIPAQIAAGLLGAAAVITTLGLAQAAGLAPWLPPIDPFQQVHHGSLLGYKNPAALLVTGQLFLLAGATDRGRGWRRIALATLLAAETAYLVSLQSRAAVLGLAVGIVTALALAAAVDRGLLRRLAVVAGLAVVAVAVVAAADRGVADRLGTAAGLLADPAAYLETDRGVYLRNTLAMVAVHPCGVGLGNWGVAYPVFRAVERTRAFSAGFRARRAHSDWVQMLGETGWPGLVLWTGVPLWLLAALVTTARRQRRPAAVFMAAQVAAVTLAMAVDYWSDHPALRWELMLVVVLALTQLEPPRRVAPTAAPARGARPLWLALVAMVVLAAGTSTLAESRAARKEVAAARLTILAARGSAASVAALARGWAAIPAVTPTTAADGLLAAGTLLRAGDRGTACRLTAASLALDPYSPAGLELMALVCPSPGCDQAWRAAADHVRDAAVAGFDRAYPAIECPAR